MLQERCLKILIIIFLICCVLHHIQIWRNFVIWFVVCCTTFVLLARYILVDMLIVLRSYCFIDQGNCCTPIFLLPRFFNNVEFIDKLNSICWVLLIILFFPRYNAKWCVVRYKTIIILALVDICCVAHLLCYWRGKLDLCCVARLLCCWLCILPISCCTLHAFRVIG